MGKTVIPKNRPELVELGEVCQKISVGLAISVTPYMRKRGTKLIRNQNIRPNYFDSSSLVYVDDEFAKSQNSKRVKVGDVISVRTGANIGDTCIVPNDFDGALTFTTLISRPNKKLLDSHYLSQYMNSWLGRSEVNRLMAGGGKGNLNSGELKKYLVLLPPIEEQRKIAEILETWDSAIALTENLIAAKQKLKKILIMKIFPNNIKAKIAGWSWRNLEDIVFINRSNLSENTNSEQEFYYVDLSSVKQSEINIPEAKIKFSELPSRARRLAKYGNVIMATVSIGSKFRGRDLFRLPRQTKWVRRRFLSNNVTQTGNIAEF
jgi:restriction endonuclease S subunit